MVRGREWTVVGGGDDDGVKARLGGVLSQVDETRHVGRVYNNGQQQRIQRSEYISSPG